MLGSASWAATIQALCSSRVITNMRVREAMEAVDRVHYCQQFAIGCYDDNPLPIGWGITISAPHMHARALEELNEKLKPGATALDVGSGSGFLSVAMALMVGDTGKVVGIDHIDELVEWSRSNVRRDGKQALVDNGQLELHVHDGFKGYPEQGPYDAIHVGAAPETIPEALKQQLKPGGVLLLPVGPTGGAQEFVRVQRGVDNPSQFAQKSLFGVRYVPLTVRSSRTRVRHCSAHLTDSCIRFTLSHRRLRSSSIATNKHEMWNIFYVACMCERHRRAPPKQGGDSETA